MPALNCIECIAYPICRNRLIKTAYKNSKTLNIYGVFLRSLYDICKENAISIKISILNSTYKEKLEPYTYEKEFTTICLLSTDKAIVDIINDIHRTFKLRMHTLSGEIIDEL